MKNSMKKYDSYRDSGIEWLGEMPSHWKVNRLGSLGVFSKGGGFSKSDLVEENGVAAVLYGDIYTKHNYVIRKPYRLVSSATAKKAVDIRFNDLLFTGSGETKEDIGKCVVLKYREKVVAGGDVIIFTQLKNESKYLSYFLNSNGVKYEKARTSKGEIIVHTYASKLREIIVTIPPIKEQQAIAAFLDNKCGQIDKAIEIKEKQIELLKEQRQIIIHNAVTKGIDKNVKLRDSGVDWIGDIPEHWEVKRLKNVVFMQSGETISAEQFIEEGYPVYGGNGFRGFTNRYTNHGRTILIGRQGALCGNINFADGKFFASEHAIVVYPNDKENLIWLGSALQCANFNRLSQSAAQPGIAVNVIKNVSFCYPCKREQELIGNYIEEHTTKIDKAVEIKAQQIEKLKEYKQSLINEVVTGKVRVS